MTKWCVNKLRSSVAVMICAAVISTQAVPVPEPERAKIDDLRENSEPRTPMAFEQNLGQFDPRVKFAARSAGAAVFIAESEAVYVLPLERPGGESPLAYALRMKIAGAKADAPARGETRTGQISSYMKGGDPRAWRTSIPHFETVRVENVYDGVSMIWRGDGASARYDFVIAPGADPDVIEMEFDGADKIETDAAGNLLIHTPAGMMTQSKPFSFQGSGDSLREIPSAFRVAGGKVGFELGEYDRSMPLTIDPTVTLNNLAFSTLIGSFGDEFSNDIAVDRSGNTYITGRTLSTTFPVTTGTFDPTANGAEDIFVTKINPSGTGIVFSTYLGGPNYDEGNGIAVDAAGNVFVAGAGGSAYPTSAGAYDGTFNGGSDVVVTKLNPTGTSLIYSTYIGASNIEFANDIAVDSSGDAYIAVRTSDALVDYPTTPGAFDTTHNGSDDVAVTRLNDTGSALIYSTFLGGSFIDNGTAIAVNTAGEAFVGGSTTDDVTDFPVTAGAYDTTHNGVTDFFATKINSDGTALVYSTFIGGPGIDNADALAIDAVGNVYIGGGVASGFPTTFGVLDTTPAGSTEIGLSKLNATGSALAYSTYIGGTQGESVNAIAADQFGNVFLTGSNNAGDYPTTAGAYDTTFNGTTDAILSVVNAGATALIYSTYIGGGAADVGGGIALDEAGNAYLTGRTVANAAVYPTTPSAYQTFHSGGSDAFVSKFGDFAIGGKVVDPSGNPLANVMVAMSGQVSGNMITGTDGRFGFTDTVPGEPHAVTATRSGYSINPAVFNIAALNNNRELIFVGTPGSPTGGSGGTLSFQHLSYSKSENGGTVTLNVRRTGELSSVTPVTVDFSTSNGTAVAGADYQPASGVLTFNAFENLKTVTIPLTNDPVLEPRETFTVTISNPTNNSDIEPGRATAVVQLLDEDLSNGGLLISEFRSRGRLGPNDEYVKIFNPNPFDVTINTADGSSGITLAHVDGDKPVPIAAVPNLVTIAARGHYLFTNNNPSGGFSVIDYPTGRGGTTAVGDAAFSADIPDNASLVLLNTANPAAFVQANAIDAVGFGISSWSKGKSLPEIDSASTERCYFRRLSEFGVTDTGNNAADFMLVDNHAVTFAGTDSQKVYSTLGSPAPETSESLRIATPGEVSVAPFGMEIYDPLPVPNGRFGSLTLYRRITNNTPDPIVALRLRAVDFPTAGNPLSRRTSARPDFRLLPSTPGSATHLGTTLAAARLQPNGGGLNSTLVVDAISADSPLMPGESVVIAFGFGVMRWGRHSFTAAVEAGH